jgi:hypothetical protein
MDEATAARRIGFGASFGFADISSNSCRFRKLYPFDSRAAANQNIITE